MQDLTAKTFGRLTVVGYVGSNKHHHQFWLCECACRNEVVARSSDLKGGQHKSCGCLSRELTRERFLKHGQCPRSGATSTYVIWSGIFARCCNSKNKHFSYYGGRGITVCERWRKFENFYADMGDRPPGMSIDRYPDNDGNYEPGNCRWATRKEQRANQRPRSLKSCKAKDKETKPLPMKGEK